MSRLCQGVNTVDRRTLAAMDTIRFDVTNGLLHHHEGDRQVNMDEIDRAPVETPDLGGSTSSVTYRCPECDAVVTLATNVQIVRS
jgi:hypothetical protein